MIVQKTGINWIWFYKGEIEGNTFHVYENWREHKFDRERFHKPTVAYYEIEEHNDTCIIYNNIYNEIFSGPIVFHTC